MPQSELDSDTVKTILSEYKIHNADVTLKYDATSDDLIDVIEGNRIYVPCIYLLNKIGKLIRYPSSVEIYFCYQLQIKLVLKNWMLFIKYHIVSPFRLTTNGILMIF